MPAGIPNPPLLPKHVRIQLPPYLPRQPDLEIPRCRGVPFPFRPGVGQGWRDVMPGDDRRCLILIKGGCVGEPPRVRLVKDVVNVEFRKPGEAEGCEDPGGEEERGGDGSDEGGVGGGGVGCGGGGGGWAGGGGEDPVVEEGVDFAAEGGRGVDGCSWQC